MVIVMIRFLKSKHSQSRNLMKARSTNEDLNLEHATIFAGRNGDGNADIMTAFILCSTARRVAKLKPAFRNPLYATLQKPHPTFATSFVG